MPQFSKIPRNWQAAAFFQRKIAKSIGYIVGFSAQLILINLYLRDFVMVQT